MIAGFHKPPPRSIPFHAEPTQVLGVCRRILRNPADADDAFQAAFLVLARKAATIGTRELLAQWLYGVAYNTARKLRQANTRRATRERPLSESPEPHANTPNPHAELLAILDEELGRLPERYRATIVLCDLEGNTRKEAARLMGCPEGTVAGRLARARAMLAARLASRGVAPAVGLLSAILTERVTLAASAVVGVGRAVSVSNLASATAKGLISSRVADTTEGVLNAMFLTNVRTVAVAALCCGLLFACAAGFLHFASAQPAPGDPMMPLVTEDKAKPPPMEKPKPPAMGEKVLTAFPLKKLDAEATAKVLAKSFDAKLATITPMPDEHALLIFADAKTTKEIEETLVKLGEKAPKKPSVVPVSPALDVTETATLVRKLFPPDVVIIPVPADQVLLVYASDEQTREIRKFIRPHLQTLEEPAKPAPAGEPKKYTFRFKNAKWGDVLDWYA
ncbi:MAG: RNA polymerase sigma factor, partial [Planctomycetia bacterium]|nr:RNA polymerase sigma factor [Planctomycetia bacterium]